MLQTALLNGFAENQNENIHSMKSAANIRRASLLLIHCCCVLSFSITDLARTPNNASGYVDYLNGSRTGVRFAANAV